MKCSTLRSLNENRPVTGTGISTKAIRIRRWKGCLDSIGVLRQAIADAVDGVQQWCGKGLVEYLA